MSFTQRLARQQEAIFARLGTDANWPDIAEPVRVIVRENDAVFGQTVADTVKLRVRQSEVAEPREAQIVEVVETGLFYEIIGTPLLDHKLVWNCEAAPSAAP